VRRAGIGDAVELVGRSGGRAAARVREADRARVAVEVIELLPDAAAVRPVHVLAAVPKRDLMDDVVRRLSEVGAARLSPIRAERSVVAPGDAKIDRWRRIAREAVRQCGRGTPLAIDAFAPFAEALGAVDACVRLVLDPRAPRRRFSELGAGAPSIAVAIGPEGGFTAAEIELAQKGGFVPVCLGVSILRVETAAIAAAILAVDALGE
jgi:16S rRNA (uracil1498-N3)-methyltransferase